MKPEKDFQQCTMDNLQCTMREIKAICIAENALLNTEGVKFLQMSQYRGDCIA